MKRKIPIIKTKFKAPLIKDTYIQRPALTRKLNHIVDYPLILLHSGPGYGKSTTLSNFLDQNRVEYCWYGISKQDDDFIPFLIHFVYSIRSKYANFGDELLHYLMNEQHFNYEDELEFLCSEFINYLEGIDNELVIVLDDYHLIEHTDLIQKWMQLLIEFLPQHIHLVISGRKKPDWSCLTTMLVKGSLLEITERNLLFSQEEIDVLFSDYYEISLTENEVKHIFDLTEGWIIAIQMIWQQIKTETESNWRSINHISLSSLDELFRYLAFEIFQKQSNDIQHFLMQTSIFEEMNVELCNQVLRIDHSSEIFLQLVSQNLFITQIDDGQFRYHALFRDFLVKQLQLDLELYKKSHLSASTYFINIKDYEKAIEHLLQVKEFNEIAKLLVTIGNELITKGKIETFLDLLHKIPDNLKDQYYMLWYFKGEIYRYQCQYQQALEQYKRVELFSHDAGDYLAMCAGLEGQARIYLDTIQPLLADDLLKRAIDTMEEQQIEISQDKKIKLYSLLAENLINLGYLFEAESWIKRCKQENALFNNIELEARLYLRAGKLELASKVLEQQRSCHLYFHLSKSHRETDLLRSIIYSFTGEFDKAKKLAEASILQGVKWKAPFVEACGWMRLGHSVQLMDYDQQMKINAYETALSIMDDIQVSRGKAEPLMGLCLLYGRSGSYELALEHGKLALLETEKVKDKWVSSLIRLSLGIAAYYHHDKQNAYDRFLEAEKSFETCGGQYGLMITSFWLSLVTYELKEWKAFDHYVNRFLHFIHEQAYQFFIMNKTLFGLNDMQGMVPFLLEAKKRKIKDACISKILDQLGLKEVTTHPGYTLTIQTFGEFNVWLGQEKLVEKDWKREKAKELLQFLLIRKGSFIPKSEIFTHLWADSDEQAATRDFKVALNALNKAIEPNRKARATPFFIERQGSAYRLSNRSVKVDVEEFELHIEEGLIERNRTTALTKLLKGVSLYKGDYLQERRFADWCLTEQDRLRVLFIRAAERLAQIYVAKEDFDNAIRYCDEILSRDNCWEEAYRLLMYCYYRKNNRPYSLKLYDKCCEILKEEMGVEPLETTKQMYKMIIEANRTHI